MRLSSLTWALALTSFAAAAPSRRSNLVVHERRAQEPRDWILTRRLEPGAVLPMRFGLTQSNMHKVEEMLMSVAHPSSSTYGKHFSMKEIVDTFAPATETIERVVDWLVGEGIDRERLKLSASKGWIEVDATAEEAEALLDAEYHVYTHAETGAKQIGMCSICAGSNIADAVCLCLKQAVIRTRCLRISGSISTSSSRRCISCTACRFQTSCRSDRLSGRRRTSRWDRRRMGPLSMSRRTWRTAMRRSRLTA